MADYALPVVVLIFCWILIGRFVGPREQVVGALVALLLLGALPLVRSGSARMVGYGLLAVVLLRGYYVLRGYYTPFDLFDLLAGLFEPVGVLAVAPAALSLVAVRHEGSRTVWSRLAAVLVSIVLGAIAGSGLWSVIGLVAASDLDTYFGGVFGFPVLGAAVGLAIGLAASWRGAVALLLLPLGMVGMVAMVAGGSLGAWMSYTRAGVWMGLALGLVAGVIGLVGALRLTSGLGPGEPRRPGPGPRFLDPVRPA